MKILFVIQSGLKIATDFRSQYQMGAIEQQIFGIAKCLLQRGHQVFIMRKWDNSEKEEICGVKLINIKLPFVQKTFKESISLFQVAFLLLECLLFSVKAFRKIRELNPDIINMSTLTTAYFVSKLKTPNSLKIFITHDYDVILRDKFSILRKIMLKSICNNTDGIVTLNNGMGECLNANGVKIDAIIPNAVNPENYKNNGDKGFILYSGRLVPHKKVEDLIQVYSEIARDFNENLVIIGSGPCEKILRDYAMSLGIKKRIRFLSFLPISKYREYLSKCSVFVLPSKFEAFGVVIIEAMASGKPVIARNIVGPKDIITHGYNGLLFKDNKELKECIKLLLSNKKLRKKMGNNGRITVEEKYTFSKVADLYEKLYSELAARANNTNMLY
jgi:glycosyltransferase involved in cell wall biosynthesis